MLSFEQKLRILEEFPRLSKKTVSLGRVNFQYEGSAFHKKNVVYHLHPNGNGFVYGGLLSGYPTDGKGYINIRDFSAEELRHLVSEAIASLSEVPEEVFPPEIYENDSGFTLELVKEGDLFNIYAGENLDGTFKSHAFALSYLEQEGFSRKYY